ncbi:hypothetical protein Q5P01_004240 [Channa striata]|uniref:Uncharacterized protein n=1 Tax=Channa striata TaxID=64152 RepID=A0AA88T3G1_CHASR|nr:hypothetical protein Q5P01_004240 [Channa striata]
MPVTHKAWRCAEQAVCSEHVHARVCAHQVMMRSSKMSERQGDWMAHYIQNSECTLPVIQLGIGSNSPVTVKMVG